MEDSLPLRPFGPRGACHPHEALLRGASSLQLMQLRQAIGIPRTTLESWADWNQRSLRFARTVLAKKPQLRWSAIVLKMIWRIHGHVARHMDDGVQLLGWRDQAWPAGAAERREAPQEIQCQAQRGEAPQQSCSLERNRPKAT